MSKLVSTQFKIALAGIAVSAALVGASLSLAALQIGWRSPSVDADFRLHARALFEMLYREPCPGAPGIASESDHAKAREELNAFKDRLRGTSAAVHLEIALDDARYAITEQPRCSIVSTISLRDSVGRGVAQLQVLAPKLADLPLSISPKPAAEFRSVARRVIQFAHPECNVSYDHANEEILGQAWAEISRFERRIEGTDFAFHYDIAESDVALLQSMRTVNCAPFDEKPAVLRREQLKYARGLLAELEAKVSNR